MKVRKNYVLFINGFTNTAFYGGDKFNRRISRATFGDLYDCTLTQLKINIKMLLKNNVTVLKMKW